MIILPNGEAVGSINYAELAALRGEGAVQAEAAPSGAAEAAPPEPEPETSSAPKHYDAKGEWVDYAVSQGADRDEAESLTKQDLIEMYGGE